MSLQEETLTLYLIPLSLITFQHELFIKDYLLSLNKSIKRVKLVLNLDLVSSLSYFDGQHNWPLELLCKQLTGTLSDFLQDTALFPKDHPHLNLVLNI